MNKQLFLTAELRLASPLAIGCGLSEFTDNDVLLDVNEKPYIPGTSIAGVCRHYLRETGLDTDDLFGIIKKDSTNKTENESRIVFYNCELSGNGRFNKKFRDGVRIGDDGTAEDTGKFNYEIIEIGDNATFFAFRMEIENYSENDKEALDRILSGLSNGEIRVGHKTNRGFGQLKIDNVKYLLCENINDLIAFNWNNVSSAYSFDKNATRQTAFSREFDIRSFLTVANNATNIPKDDGSGIINSEALKNSRNNPVIPGTSWAGVFRHHFKKILTESGLKNENEAEDYLVRLFGTTEKASGITFEETELIGSHCMLQTRNAIDRFTAGACDKKLFTNQLAFGGHLKLTVRLTPALSDDDKNLAQNLIELTFNDLEDGSLNVGGLGAVGGGMMKRRGAN